MVPEKILVILWLFLAETQKKEQLSVWRKINPPSVVEVVPQQEHSCLSCIPTGAGSFSPRAIWTRMPFYLSTPLFCHEEGLNHWWQWFHAECNDTWDHHPILAMAESCLDLKVSKGRSTLVSLVFDSSLVTALGRAGQQPRKALLSPFPVIPVKLRRSLAAFSRGKESPWRQRGPLEVSSLGSFLGPSLRFLQISLKTTLLFPQPHNICFKLMFIW